jgi:hypothetical protein
MKNLFVAKIWKFRLTTPLEQGLHWEDYSRSASQEISCLICNPDIHYHIHISRSVAFIRGQIFKIEHSVACQLYIASVFRFPPNHIIRKSPPANRTLLFIQYLLKCPSPRSHVHNKKASSAMLQKNPLNLLLHFAGRIFHFCKTTRPFLGPIQPPIQWILGCLLDVRLLGYEAIRTHLTGAEFKDAWNYTYTPPYI